MLQSECRQNDKPFIKLNGKVRNYKTRRETNTTKTHHWGKQRETLRAKGKRSHGGLRQVENEAEMSTGENKQGKDRTRK